MAALCSPPSNHRRRVAIVERLADTAVQLEPIGSTTEVELLQPMRLASRKRLPEQPISCHLAHIRALGVTHFALAQVEALPVIARCCSSASQSHAGTLAAWSCRTPQTKAPSRRSVGNNRIMQHNSLTATAALAVQTTAVHQQQHQQLRRRHRHSIVAAIALTSAAPASASPQLHRCTSSGKAEHQSARIHCLASSPQLLQTSASHFAIPGRQRRCIMHHRCLTSAALVGSVRNAVIWVMLRCSALSAASPPSHANPHARGSVGAAVHRERHGQSQPRHSKRRSSGTSIRRRSITLKRYSITGSVILGQLSAARNTIDTERSRGLSTPSSCGATRAHAAAQSSAASASVPALGTEQQPPCKDVGVRIKA